MFKILLALHLLAAIFAIGPLVHAATTSSRALRQNDAGAASSAARALTIYSYASIVVVFFGFALMSAKAPWDKSKHVADFGDAWIWLSIVLWACSLAVTFGGLVPGLKQAAVAIGGGESTDALRGRLAMFGGVVGLLFAVIVFLMVYQPGS